ncbi:MAG: RNA 2'-phosphotransferase [Verrucomicrobiales bacterium]|nr:RNA 2'-phosphotransferase [Verrucomicrobiales bacterium]
MTPDQTTRTSKFLSLVLRHQPDAAHVTLDPSGWVDVANLLEGCAKGGCPISRDDLNHVVATNVKKRFEFNADQTRIRASQGHSVEVDLAYTPESPPELLYHGTATRFLNSIREKGLLKMQRHHVHLSAETQVTQEVGARHGRPALLTILGGQMHREGHVFFRSTNGVWLVEHVPPQYIQFA